MHIDDPTPNLLCYGGDWVLLQTRALVLRSAGFAVSTVDSAEEFRQALYRTCPDVIVLCHSLSWEARTAAMELATLLSASSRLVVLIGYAACRRPEPEHHVFASGGGPEELIRTVQKIVAMCD